jgi:hypothetical protein
MNGNLAGAQFPFGKSAAHQFFVDILFDLFEAVLMAERVNEGDVRRIPPDLGSEIRIRIADGARVSGNLAVNLLNVGGIGVRVLTGMATLRSLFRGVGHDFFDFVGVAGEAFAQEFVAGFGDEDVVLNADPEIFFGDVNAGLDGDDHAGFERFAILAGIVDVEADVVAEAVNEILAKRFAVKILAVGIDVVEGNFVDALGAALAIIHAWFDGGESGVLRAEDDFINFALARREFSVGGKRARDVGRVPRVLSADVEDDDVSVFDFARKLVVVQRGGIGAGADDGGVAFGFRAAHGVDFDHFGGDLVFVQAWLHHAHGGEVSVERKLDGLREKRNFAGRFDLAQFADVGANVFQLGLRNCGVNPIDDGFFVGIAAIFLFVRKDCANRRVSFRQFFESGAHFGVGLHRDETSARLDAWIGRRNAEAVPFFLGGIFRGKKKNFLRNIGDSSGRAAGIRCSGFLGGKNNQAGAFFVVAGEVIEIVFLSEDVGLRGLFAAGEAPEEDGRVDLRGEFGAARGIDAVRFAVAAFLGLRLGGQRCEAQENQRDGEDGR